MKICEIVDMLEKEAGRLSQLRTSAANIGDVEQVAQLDAELAETQDSLTRVKSVAS